MWRKTFGKTVLTAALLCSSALPVFAESDEADSGTADPRPTVSAGAAYTLQLEPNDGTVWVFGKGPRQNSRQIGRDEGGALEGIVQISPGYTHAAAVDDDGRVWVWGDNTDGQLGQPGQLGQNDEADYTGAVAVPLPKQSGRIVSAAAGYDHTLALDEDGTVWAWGNNQYGQLGRNGKRNPEKPVQVMNGSEPLGDIAAVAAGRGLSYALSEKGEVWTWGDYEKKDGSLQRVMRQSGDRLVPLSGVAAIAAGLNHALALTEDGSLYAWGSNREGQLGIGSDELFSLHARKVSGSIRWKAMDAGYGTSAAIDEDGRLWVWGATFPYKNRKLEAPSRSAPQLLSSAGIYTEVSLGEYHGVALDEEARIWVWGDNNESQLGHAVKGWSFNQPVIRKNLERSFVSIQHTSLVVKETVVDGQERVIRLHLKMQDPAEKPLIDKWPTAETSLMGRKPIIAPFERPVSLDGYYAAELRVPLFYDINRPPIQIRVDGVVVAEITADSIVKP